MIQQAIASDDPVIFFEPKRRYWEKAEVDLDAGADAAPALHRGRGRCAGQHVTLAAYGPMVKTCLEAATVAAEEGRSSRSSTCARSRRSTSTPSPRRCEKTGRLVVVHEAPTFLGVGAEIAAADHRALLLHLEAPVLRVGGFDLPYPPSKLEEDFLPDLDRVLDAVDRSLAY